MLWALFNLLTYSTLCHSLIFVMFNVGQLIKRLVTHLRHNFFHNRIIYFIWHPNLLPIFGRNYNFRTESNHIYFQWSHLVSIEGLKWQCFQQGDTLPYQGCWRCCFYGVHLVRQKHVARPIVVIISLLCV